MAGRKYKQVDVLVIGGGINGAGIARDLAGRGLSVFLCEKDDLASGTSAASTKIIHGGLRYLEHREFGLVRASLKEREVLLKSAPHIVRPLSFIMPHDKKLRPRWLIRLGLFLYDHIGGRQSLPKSKGINLFGTVPGQPLRRELKHGFSYSDCWAEDTRLVILSALDASEKGAEILPRMECVKLEKHPKDKGWIVTLLDTISEEKHKLHAQMIVNAAGPWVAGVRERAGQEEGVHRVRHVKGSHIVLPRLYKGPQAYVLQNTDRRIIFVIPYEEEYTLVGTTEVDYTGDLDAPRIEMEEVEYLCAAVNAYFRKQIGPEDVIWTYSGVRPLVDDGKSSASAVSRDYILDCDMNDGAPLLTVYGGKLTTFRKLSEQAGNAVVAALGKGKGPWTEKAQLPGGEGIGSFATFLKNFRREFGWLPEHLAQRYARAYGTRARDMLRAFKRPADMGIHLGDDVYECEIRYLAQVEWAMTAEDILWRRSKLGLHVSEETEKNVKKMLKKILSGSGSASG